MLQGAMELGKAAWYKMPTGLVVRLLGTLCNDASQCAPLHSAITERVDRHHDMLVRVALAFAADASAVVLGAFD